MVRAWLILLGVGLCSHLVFAGIPQTEGNDEKDIIDMVGKNDRIGKNGRGGGKEGPSRKEELQFAKNEELNGTGRRVRVKMRRKSMRLTRGRFMRQLHMEQDQDITDVRRFRTKRGKQKVKLQQKYKGVQIFGSTVVAETDGGTFTGWAEGTLARNLRLDLKGRVNPAVPRRRALKSCKRRQGHMGIKVQDPEIKLYIYEDYVTNGNKKNILVYFVKYFISSPTLVARPVCLVHAIKGTILESYDGLETFGHFMNPVQLTNCVGGNPKTKLYKYGEAEKFPPIRASADINNTRCRLEDKNIFTYDLEQQWTLPYFPKEFDCKSGFNDSVNGGYSPLNDAHFFASVTDYAFKTYLGVPALPAEMHVFVHFGLQYENAFYYNGCLFFGDGQEVFYPLICPDVMGHEVSHGFTDSYSKLSRSGEAWGISESFSDAAGEFVEFVTKGQCDMGVAYDIVKQKGYVLRDMCNPTVDEHSIDHLSDYWYGMDGHYSSGIYNRAFCLLAMTKGWGVINAFIVFARANMAYWNEVTTFNEGVCGLEMAADDEGFTKSDVTAAFREVGVACPPPPPPPTTPAPVTTVAPVISTVDTSTTVPVVQL